MHRTWNSRRHWGKGRAGGQKEGRIEGRKKEQTEVGREGERQGERKGRVGEYNISKVHTSIKYEI